MYVDLDMIFAQIKKDDRLKETSDLLLKSEEKQYTSALTLVELEIVLKREVSDFLSKETAGLFREKFPRILIVGFDKKILEKSLELRQKYDLGIFDSVHAATALRYDKRIASTDAVFERVLGLKIIQKQ